MRRNRVLPPCGGGGRRPEGGPRSEAAVLARAASLFVPPTPTLPRKGGGSSRRDARRPQAQGLPASRVPSPRGGGIHNGLMIATRRLAAVRLSPWDVFLPIHGAWWAVFGVPLMALLHWLVGFLAMFPITMAIGPFGLAVMAMTLLVRLV